jgi:uncharacterized protein YacL
LEGGEIVDKIIGFCFSLVIVYVIFIITGFVFPKAYDNLTEKHSWFEPDDIMFFGGMGLVIELVIILLILFFY